MPTWVKVLLVVVLVGFVLLVAGIIVAARWVKSRAETLQEKGKIVVSSTVTVSPLVNLKWCRYRPFRRW